MPGGRPPQPTAIKKLHGVTRKDRLNPNEPDPKEASGYCPRHLSPIAKKEWRRVTPELMLLGLFTVVDSAALEAYCECYATWREAKSALRENGLTWVHKGYIAQRPEVSIANNALKLMKSFLVEFGMTPSARTKVPGKPREVKDPFAEFLDGPEMSRSVSELDE